MKDGLFDNPNGVNATCSSTKKVEKNLMYGRDKMCPRGKNAQGKRRFLHGSSEVRSGKASL
ncbi:hypothetical protein YSA_05234 [Pseudomonas putida ND6]|uniref:Uncharacterized protein n=1 Tax=Pseudomonas putida ND6 TaxID=231023 RepID=I3UVT0_PSEPU|nr:hypothetical protein YSA_05234 [Pseudomonas putida ND6]